MKLSPHLKIHFPGTGAPRYGFSDADLVLRWLSNFNFYWIRRQIHSLQEEKNASRLLLVVVILLGECSVHCTHMPCVGGGAGRRSCCATTDQFVDARAWWMVVSGCTRVLGGRFRSHVGRKLKPFNIPRCRLFWPKRIWPLIAWRREALRDAVLHRRPPKSPTTLFVIYLVLVDRVVARCVGGLLFLVAKQLSFFF
jgi:hypothetical protein